MNKTRLLILFAMALLVLGVTATALAWENSAERPPQPPQVFTGTAPEGAQPESLAGSYVVFDSSAGGATCYIPGNSQTFCFRAESFTNDWEYAYNVWLKFPTDWTVTNVSIVGTPVCDSGTFGTLSWSFETSPFEVNIYHPRYQASTDHCVVTYCVDVIAGAPAPTAPESWYWDGDGYGSAPHNPCSSDSYTPGSMAGQPCDEALQPPASIPVCSMDPGVYLMPPVSEKTGCNGAAPTFDFSLYNNTGAAGTFDLSYAVPTGFGTLTGPADITAANGEIVDFSVQLETELCAIDGTVIEGEITADGNGYSDVANAIYTVTDVGGWTQVPASAPSWAGNGYVVDGCTATNSSGELVTYLIGDMSGTGPVGFWGYNHVTNAWTQPAPTNLPADRWAPDWAYDPATNLCYMTGGANTPGGGTYNEAYVFDPVANAFTALPSLTTVRDFHDSWVGTLSSTKYLCVGGGVTSDDVILTSTQCYDILGGTWAAEDATLAPYPVDVFGAADGTLFDPAGDQFWFVGGAINAGATLSDAAYYWDGTAWVAAGNTGLARYRVEGDFLDGVFYFVGGSSGGFSPTDTVAVGENIGGTWTWSAFESTMNSRMDNIANAGGGTMWSLDGYGDFSADYVEYLEFCPACAGPDINLITTELVSTQLPDTITTGVLEFENVGTEPLDWEILEDPLRPARPLPAKAGAETAPVTRAPEGALALGDLLFEVDFQAATLDNQHLGVEFDGAYYWTTGGNSAVDPNKLYKIDQAGALMATYDQPAGCSGWGGRDMAFDGVHLYFGCDDGLIHKIFPATGGEVGTFPSPVALGLARALAYDPATDHFWAANWDSTIYEFDRTGAVINTLPAVGLSTYGLAWDAYSPGGPYLWAWSQDGPDPMLMASQINPVTGALTGVSFLGAGVAGEMAGGAAISDSLVPGKLVFLGLTQGNSDRVGVYDMLDIATSACTGDDIPWVSVDPLSGTTLPGEITTLAVTYDSTGLAMGSYAGNICVDSNDPDEPSVSLPVFLNVVEVTKTAPATAPAHSTIEYAITLTGPENFNGTESMIDVLPPEVEFGGFVEATYGTASYDEGLNAIVWTPSGPKPAAPLKPVIGALPEFNVKLEANGAKGPTAPAPAAPEDAVVLVLDDGSRENDIGLGGTVEMLWVNVFSPDISLFPFNLEQVQVYFSSVGLVNVGDDIILLVYQDDDGNPANGATFLAQFPTTMLALDAWSVYDLPSPVALTTPGDVWVGVLAMETPGTSYWPASMDQTTTQARSWAGWWNTSPPPDPPILPPPNWTLIDAYFPGNWMVRGYGNTASAPNTVTITFNAIITAPEGEITNTAVFDYLGATLEATAVTTIIPTDVDLAVEKTASAAEVFAGDEVVYTLSVSNAGPADATGVTLEDTLPAGVTFVAAPGCTEAGGVVTCDVGDLAVGATAEFAITVTAPMVPGLFTNSVVAAANETDLNLDDNTASADVTVLPQADLAIEKTASADPVEPGGELVFTLVVTNNGPDDATGVVVEDTLPAGVTFVGAPGCTEVGGVVTCDVGDLASGASVSFDITVTVPAEAGEITNTAIVSGNEADPMMENNTASVTVMVEVAGYQIFLPVVAKAPAE